MTFFHQNNKRPQRDRTALLFLAAYASSAGIGAIAAIMPPPVYAAHAETPRTKVVRYGDLNLASEYGTAELKQRIYRAAKLVCEPVGVPAIVQRKKVRNCIDKAQTTAWTSAQEKIGKYRLAFRADN